MTDTPRDYPRYREEVARAIAMADLDPDTRAIVNLDAHMDHVRDHYSELADAAIAALRKRGAFLPDVLEQIRKQAGEKR